MARPIFIVDLEATCWDDRGHYTVDETEIIEIGCVLATPDGTVLDEFCTFVRPVKDPILSDFCTQLTSIRQSDVEKAPTYQEAMHLFDAWIAARPGIWGSWGNYDYREFSSLERRFPSNADFLCMQHVNLKKAWKKTTGHPRCGLHSALAFHDLEFLGTHHRGIDDARNMARLLPFIDYQRIRAGVGALQREDGCKTY
jgi:inhibitor of KinA sporulation pathway (predicted exonuclease)